MSIQKINIGGEDVEIEDVSARTNITNINNTIGSETLQTTSKTLKGAINEVKQSVSGSGGGGGLPCIDTSNIIYEQSSVINEKITYTATEDCIMCLSLGLWSYGTYINVNNTRVFDADCGSSSNGAPSFMTLNLKKGDVFKYSPSGNSSNRISFSYSFTCNYNSANTVDCTLEV